MEATLIMSQVYSANLMTRAVSVCMYLFNRANRNLQCFPGIRTIARDLKMSEPTVKRALRDLVTAGFVQKETRWRENGGQSSNLYILKPVEKSVETPANVVENFVTQPEKTPAAQEHTNVSHADEQQHELEIVQEADDLSVQPAKSSPIDAPSEDLCQCAVDEPSVYVTSDSPCVATQTQKHFVPAFLRPVLQLLSRLRPKMPAFFSFVNPAPGHEFTPKVNLSVYHYQKGKNTSRKKKVKV